MPEAHLPLHGIRVLDLTRVLAGPFATRLLADLGADVIKVEEPGQGDPGRGAKGPEWAARGGSPMFMDFNRNKRSLTLNLKAEEGRGIFRRLAASADVVVENFRPDVMDSLKLGPEALRAVTPRLIYCSISGFGRDGPYRARPAYDQIAQGMAGLMSVTGDPAGEPMSVGTSIADSIAGICAAFGVVTALFDRARTGIGQEVQTSLLEGLIACLSWRAHDWLGLREVSPRTGNHLGVGAPSGTFRARDGYLNIAAHFDAQWERLCQALGLEELLREPALATIPGRMAARERLTRLITERLAARTVADWTAVLNGAGVPCGPILRIDEVFADPQVRHREMELRMEHPKAGTVRMLGYPVKFSRGSGALRRPAPLLGEHTDEILREVGYSVEEIARLRARGVL